LSRSCELWSQESVFGFDGGPTVRTVVSIAKLLWDRQDFEGAELLYKRAIDSLLRTDGELHEFTLTTLQSLGTMFYDIERIREGEALLRRSYLGRKATLGILTELTLDASLSLAKALNVTAEWKHEPDYREKLLESEELSRICVNGRAKMFGPTSVVCLDAKFVLADFLLEHRRYSEAEVEYRSIFGHLSSYLGNDDTQTARAAYGVGVCLQYQRLYSEAVPFFDIAQTAYANAWGMENGHSSIVLRHRKAISDAAEMFKYTKTRAKQSEYHNKFQGSIYSGR
jgi:tetratricopeptide (TPR) repeat protein